MDSTEDAPFPLPRRLNGRLAACDPCRLRKVACDHTRPVCNRCRRRASSSECVYSEPDPRTRPLKPPRRPAPNASPLQPSSSDFAERSPQERPLSWSSQSGSNTPTHDRGYLGATSFGAVFEEARNSLSLLSALDLNQTHVQSRRDEDSVFSRELTPPLQEMCLYVLRCLADHLNEDCEQPEDIESDHHGWEDEAVDRIINSLRLAFAHSRDQGEKGLQLIAEKISHNTERPLRDDVATVEDWLGQFCGGNLRWESLGLLWAYLQRVSDILHSISCHRFDWLAAKYSAKTGRTCLDYCVTISRHLADQSTLLLDVARRKATLESIVCGEARVQSFVSFGIVVTMMTFLGLHVQQSDALYRPTLCSELRRRIFAQVFVSDKLVVSFTGRPPLLSRRFCTTPLPLDIRDEDLAAEPEVLDRAVASLDQNGWNTDGGLYSATLIRARTMIAYVRDELIEIALSQNTLVSLDHLQEIRARQYQMFSEFPKSLMYQHEELTDPDVDVRKVYVKVLLHLEHLKNIFFAERLLLLHGHVDSSDIIVTSFSMLKMVLLFWTHRERFSLPSIRREFDWDVLVYGAPAAGILCLELLRPTIPRLHPKNNEVSRSNIIQQLSLLVALLDWVNPSAPNRDLCVDSRTIIQRVLDHHLNFGTDVTMAHAPMDWGPVSVPDFSFDLINTFDWVRSGTQ
ncbi:hypothetical protein E8E14_007763 [Neopestalotiopsis sp. 37M]|nr:hypothetical protein E8E14_007763 [Neopestalotiopsis sp. 37M]